MKLHPKTKEAYRLQHEGILALHRAEQAGMRIDEEYCKKRIVWLDKKIDRISTKIKDTQFGRHWEHAYGKRMNLNSNDQLSNFLFKIKKLEPIRTTDKGKPSTDEESLSELGIPELVLLLDMRKLSKIQDYLKAYLREAVGGFIHPFFNLHLVITFRSSCDHPNQQNIPKRAKEAMKIVRAALFPRFGHQFFSGDYSGVEVRMACVYTQDEKLIYDTLHGDMHRDMAIELYMLDSLDKFHPGEVVLRQGGKNGFVFPQFYGDYYGACAPSLIKWARDAYLKDETPALVHLQDKKLIRLDKDGNPTNIEKFIDHVKHVENIFWNERYRTYTKWKKDTWRHYQKKGYIDMYSGFRCSGLMSEKDISNYPFQGTAFHCLLWSFIELDRKIQKEKLDTRLVSQVHDELTADVHPPELEYVAKSTNQISTKDIRDAWDWINVPLEIEAEVADIDSSWGDRKFYPLPE